MDGRIDIPLCIFLFFFPPLFFDGRLVSQGAWYPGKGKEHDNNKAKAPHSEVASYILVAFPSICIHT